MRRHFLKQLLGLSLTLAVSGSWAENAAPLRLAVHPYASPLALIQTHRPLIQFLSRALGRPVEFFTAASFDAFSQALREGVYDIAIVPPHFGVLALEDAYLPILHYKARLVPLLVVRRDSPLKVAADLRGKRVGMADPLALIHLVALQWLAEAGLRPERDFQLIETPSHGAAVGAALAGDVDAGVSTTTALRQLPENVRQRVRPLEMERSFPHLFTLLHRRHGAAMQQKLRQALLEFERTPEGRHFLAESGFLGYEEIDPLALRAVRPYADQVRAIFQGPR